ncbi:hypothetical protein H4V97_001501 [Flavobacterium sp. CG_23.5]|uniref:hypothetical protein n=1 Tax=Flavobacterium sp. CG_23.5 TaxID=2760708 RepID=UPI001AE16AEB|nr:hypothetical protein [Flavobacterium sp. CG_23.5]MBP2283183.1 hypothetical protein [Flavobacterium sp. CG_23.5]
MKHLAIFFVLFNFGLTCSAQNFKLNIIGTSDSETKTIDSLQYTSTQTNLKLLQDEINRVSEKLSKIGYIENKILDNINTKDSSYTAKISLGKRVKFIHIYIGTNTELKKLITTNTKSDTIVIPYNETEDFLNNTIRQLEQKGFSLANIKLNNIRNIKTILFADLILETNKQRTLNAIVIKTSENENKINFPKGHLEQINKKYHDKTFNQEILKQIHDDFDNFGFVTQIKYPEILFSQDTTKVYVYLEKKKSNAFDGFIGFSNNENKKIAFTGYLDVTLENTLHTGEQFSIYWKSDGNKQKTFRANLELPYIFKTPIALKALINIFKQDSTYQNTKTAIDLGYYINYNSRFYLGYESTESSDIQNTKTQLLGDYNNSFLTSNFAYSKTDNNSLTFNKKSTFSLGVGLGKRNRNNSSNLLDTNTQFYISFQAMHNFPINQNNNINITTQNYYLHSENYILNELFRFGGLNSIRGFDENSLQANFLSSVLTEYRHTLSPSLYIHSILDYGMYTDKTITNEKKQKENLFSIGAGLGLQTKNGWLKIALANGITKNQNFKFYNTIIHICYNVKF